MQLWQRAEWQTIAIAHNRFHLWHLKAILVDFQNPHLSPTSPPKTDSNRVASDGIASAITKVVPAKYGPDKRAAVIPKNQPAIKEARAAMIIDCQ